MFSGNPCSSSPSLTLAALLLLLSALASPAAAMLTKSQLVLQPNSSVFVAKFCYSFDRNNKTVGRMDVLLSAPTITSKHDVSLILLDDEDSSYPGVSTHWESLSCDERRRHAKDTHRLRPYTQERQEWRIKVKQRLRPRWWYVALLDCSTDPQAKEMAIELEAHFFNDNYSSMVEFSADRSYCIYAIVPITLAYLVLALGQAYVNLSLKGRFDEDSAAGKAANPFTQVLSIGVALGLSDIALCDLHVWQYAQDGVGLPGVSVLAQFLAVGSNFVLVSLLLLVAEGKCVSCRMVRADAFRMIKLLGPFLLSCFLLEVWAESSQSQLYTSDFVYTSRLGWTLILCDLALLGFYLKKLQKTYLVEHSGEQAIFYKTWALFYGAWFLALPIVTVLSQLVLAPYVWLVTSIGAKKGASVIVYSAFVIGFWPGNTRTLLSHDPEPEINLKWDADTWAQSQTQQLPSLLGRSLKDPCHDKSVNGKISWRVDALDNIA